MVPIHTPRRYGDARIARDVEKAYGWGPTGMRNALERMRALGFLPPDRFDVWDWWRTGT